MGHVPVFKGGMVVALAVVDDDMVEHLYRWRWQLDRKGYAHRNPSAYKLVQRGKKVVRKRTCKNIKMHRIVAGAKPGEYVDHVNGNTLDNRRSNLEVVTNVENVYRQAARLGGHFKPRV